MTVSGGGGNGNRTPVSSKSRFSLCVVLIFVLSAIFYNLILISLLLGIR
jgi:hypothetical protein